MVPIASFLFFRRVINQLLSMRRQTCAVCPLAAGWFALLLAMGQPLLYMNYHLLSLFHVLWVHNCFSLWAHLCNQHLLVLSSARTSSRENQSFPVLATLALMTGMSDNSALLHCTALMFLFFHLFFRCSYRAMGHICHRALFKVACKGILVKKTRTNYPKQVVRHTSSQNSSQDPSSPAPFQVSTWKHKQEPHWCAGPRCAPSLVRLYRGTAAPHSFSQSNSSRSLLK